MNKNEDYSTFCSVKTGLVLYTIAVLYCILCKQKNTSTGAKQCKNKGLSKIDFFFSLQDRNRCQWTVGHFGRCQSKDFFSDLILTKILIFSVSTIRRNRSFNVARWNKTQWTSSGNSRFQGRCSGNFLFLHQCHKGLN